MASEGQKCGLGILGNEKGSLLAIRALGVCFSPDSMPFLLLYVSSGHPQLNGPLFSWCLQLLNDAALPPCPPRGREHELRASFLSFFDRKQSELLKILRNMFKCCPSHLLFRTSKARPLKKGLRGRWVLRLREGDLLAHSHSQVRWAFSSFFGWTTTGHLQSWART